MPSPFLGIDPFLQADDVWPAFRRLLVKAVYHALVPAVPDRLRVTVQERTYSVELPLFTSIVRETYAEDRIEIHRRSDHRLVAMIDWASPTNKGTRTGREAYLRNRSAALGCGASLVEIDLLFGGSSTLPDDLAGPAFAVTRAGAPPHIDAYPLAVGERMPRVPLPLGGEDRELVIDLQSAAARAYDQGDFLARIDYRGPLPKWLPAEDAKKADDYLRRIRVR